MKKILITGILGFLTVACLQASQPTFTIPILNIPVRIEQSPIPASFSKNVLYAVVLASAVYLDTNRILSIKEFGLECINTWIYMQILHGASTFFHELAHACFHKYYNFDEPNITLHCTSNFIGIAEGTTRAKPPIIKIPSKKDHKSTLLALINKQKRNEKGIIVSSIAGPATGIIVATTLGHLLQYDITGAQQLAATTNLLNLSSLLPICADGRNVCESWQRLKELKQIETELNTLPVDQEITNNSSLWQKTITLCSRDLEKPGNLLGIK